ncbi:MAG: tetratricopeptide repeat protein [Candidatus Cloacimonetes bacterium]|nr:tetratricopeptide repeat protein [Candidatus Cloacimonadota bacterium]
MFKLINILKLLALITLALSLVGCGQKNKSKAIKLNKSLSDEDAIEAEYKFGWMAGTNKKYKVAIEQFQKVLRKDPYHIGATHDLGLTYAKLNKLEKAIQYFQKTLDLQPNHAESYFNLSSAFFRLNQKDRAVQYLQECLRLSPNHPKALLRTAELDLNSGRQRDAITAYANYLKVKPFDLNVRAKLGGIYFQQGLDENAKVELKKAIRKVHKPEVYYQLGVIYHRQGNLKAAQFYYNKALKLDPNHADCLISTGEVYEQFGHRKKALVYYERAYGFEPENEYLRSKLSKLRR